MVVVILFFISFSFLFFFFFFFLLEIPRRYSARNRFSQPPQRICKRGDERKKTHNAGALFFAYFSGHLLCSAHHESKAKYRHGNPVPKWR